MNRNILLIEPKYRNKYPPIGLMKIASYHRILGDNVRFFKGDLKDLVLDTLSKKCVQELNEIDHHYLSEEKYHVIRKYIKRKEKRILKDLEFDLSKFKDQLIDCTNSYANIYRKKDIKNYPKWDRVYVTTLFTFYWKITIETIHYAKRLVKSFDHLHVGGVLASLLYQELENETGIKPYRGLLDKPGLLDPDIPIVKNIVIDNLPLDYSILYETDYEYPTGSAYFTFMTKGCTRKCAFCSVPILEPTYKDKINTIDKFFEIKKIYGEQQHLMLMDNNVLASPKFNEIIQEIKEMGFVKGATYIEPNQLDIAITNLKQGINDKAYIKRSIKLYQDLLKKLRGATKTNFHNILNQNHLIKLDTATKEGVLNSYALLKEIYEKYRSKKERMRYVDFNQGTDARYVTDDIMKLLSEIPIRPLRIAFDYWGIKDKYENAVRLAAKYGISELSNYILYNFVDKPDELYKRLEINVHLNEELGIEIYSFPMKYIPLFGEEAKSRDFIGKNWNKKFIRAIQSILNVTKGIVAPGRAFFEKAFGRNLDEYHEILYMPEAYIIYRYFFDQLGITDKWKNLFHSLSNEEKMIALSIIEKNDFSDLNKKTNNLKILRLLRHYQIKDDLIRKVRAKDLGYYKTKQYFNKLIKDDQFKELTITYDFEDLAIKNKTSIAV